MATTDIFKAPTLGNMISGAGNIYTGIAAFKSAQGAASDIEYEGEVVFREAIRTANIIVEEGRKFAAGQALQYIGAGVQLGGSALITLAQTKKYAKTEAEAVKSRGEATRELAGRTAERKRDAGRAALVGGIIGGTSSLFMGA